MSERLIKRVGGEGERERERERLGPEQAGVRAKALIWP